MYFIFYNAIKMHLGLENKSLQIYLYDKKVCFDKETTTNSGNIHERLIYNFDTARKNVLTSLRNKIMHKTVYNRLAQKTQTSREERLVLHGELKKYIKGNAFFYF